MTARTFMNHHHPLAAAVAAALVATPLLAALTILPSAAHAQARPQEQTNAAQGPEEIIVTSSMIPTPRRQIGTAVSVLEGAEIELRGYDSLADVMRTQPGIGVNNSGGPGKATSLRIRGEDSYRTMLIIDGVKAIDPTGTQAAPNFSSLLSTGDMERVEVLRGPQGFMYGADAGGVVNIISGRGADGFGARLGLEAGEFSTESLSGSLSGGNDTGDFYVSATDFSTDGFNARTTDTVLRDDDGAENTTLHAKLGWNVSENVRLQLVARDIDASTMYDGCFQSVAPFGTSHNCTGTTEQTTYRLSAELGSGDFTNAFGYSDSDIVRNDFTDGLPAFGSDGGISRFEYTGSYKASDATTLVYGLDFQDEEMLSDGQTFDRGQDGYYVEYQGSFGESFFLSAGARYDDNDDFGTHTSGRLTAAYTQALSAGNSLKYRASYGTGFRPPSLFEVSYNERPFGVLPAAAATTLQEETSKGYDLGIEYDAANGAHFEITYFDQDVEDVIVYVSDFPTSFDDGYTQSPGTSNSKGFELGAYIPFAERWAFVGNWTDNDTETAAGQQRVQRPKNIGNFGIEYTAMGNGFRFIANYRLSHDAIDSSGPLPDYEVLDLSAAYSFNDTIEVYGRVQNATDEEYQEVLSYASADRAVYGGLRLRF
jgi:vitamin B12 transporter